MSVTAYEDFLSTKTVAHVPQGIDAAGGLNPHLFGFQADVLDFLLNAGRSAAFLDTGLGKTIIQLDWARIVANHTGRPVLILAPLAVSAQTVAEAKKFGIDAMVARSQSDAAGPIIVTNYERLHLFDASVYGGVVLDESSILKSFMGKVSQQIINEFASTPFRLACTATPAPNDYTELGNHSDFLGVMPQVDMLSRWFNHDAGQTSRWKIKGHAVESFWNWVASWARCISKPSDINHSDEGFDLPDIDVRFHTVRSDPTLDAGEFLFRIPDANATGFHREKRLTTDLRADAIAAAVANDPNEPWVIWCDTNYEADAVTSRIKNAVEVRGNMTPDDKESRLLAFSRGEINVMITKPSIAGFGLNWQHCARMAFVGLSFSYESYYQAIRRCWRFGQARTVEVHIAAADTERAVLDTLTRKSGDHDAMKAEMASAMNRASENANVRVKYEPGENVVWPSWIKT